MDCSIALGKKQGNEWNAIYRKIRDAQCVPLPPMATFRQSGWNATRDAIATAFQRLRWQAGRQAGRVDIMTKQRDSPGQTFEIS